MKETIGTAFLPILKDFIGKFDEAVPFLQNFATVIAQIISGENGLEVLFSTFEDGSSYIGGVLELLGLSEEKAYALGDAINKMVTDFDLSTITGMFSDWVNTIDWGQLSRDFAEKIKSIDWVMVGDEVATGVMNILQGLGTIIGEIDWMAVFSAIGQALGDVIAGFGGFSSWEDMVHQTSTIVYYFNEAINNIKDWWSGVIDSVKQKFINTFSSIVSYIYNIFSNITISISSLYYIGRDIVNGIIDGINSMITSVLASISNLITSIVTKVKLMLGISSASTIFKDIAKNIVQGLIDGWNLLFDTFFDLIGEGIGRILELFAPFLALFGIDVSGLTGGTSVAGTTIGGSTAGGEVTNNYYFYGTTYVNGVGPEGTYDCNVRD